MPLLNRRLLIAASALPLSSTLAGVAPTRAADPEGQRAAAFIAETTASKRSTPPSPRARQGA